MPRALPAAAAAAAKKQPLTVAQLASYDDILTDALVDQVYYWTTIPKNRTSYHPSRGIREQQITKIIQDELIVDPNVAAAEDKLLSLDGLKRFYNALKTPKEKADFKAHMRRYMSIYLPDCPFEVNSTNRYTISTAEASVTARRDIRRNETIKYLAGIQVVITPEVEADMSLRKKDFSLVVSSRNKLTSLFMGPARFANHDCNANARLVTREQAGIEIIATRPIAVGEEITVEYSDSYFGEDNCECLCRTCEQQRVNGWKADDEIPSIQNSIEADTIAAAQGYSLRRRRRDDSVAGAGSRAGSITPDLRPRVLKSQRSQRMVGDRESTTSSALFDEASSAASVSVPAKRKIGSPGLTGPVTPAKKQKMTHYAVLTPPLDSASSRESSVPSLGRSPVLSETEGGNITEATSPESDSPALLLPSPDPSPTKLATTNVKREDDDNDIRVLALPEAITAATGTAAGAGVTGEETTNPAVLVAPLVSITTVSESFSLPSSDSLGVDASHTTPSPAALGTQAEAMIINKTLFKMPTETDKGFKAAACRSAATSTSRGKAAMSIDQPAMSKQHRVPEDYVLTPLLLSTPESAWIRCTICTTPFVQQDAYYTKVSCPRCERHSKLYGYVWPKTQPAGPGDKEKRVLDHRLIHRFLDRQDEARIRGRKHWNSQTADQEETSENRGRPRARAGADSEEANASAPRRSGRARRPSAKVFDE